MISNVALLIATVLLLYIGSRTNSYVISFLRTRRFGKTSLLLCVTISSPRDSFLFWMFSPWLAHYFESLPFGLGHWIRYAKKDFSWASKGELHRKELKSDVWWTVGAGGPGLWVSDADVISQITHRWKDFPKPVAQYEALEIFGPNVVTTEGTDWQRHRKITDPPFNDRNSSLVFEETLAQGKAMLASFTNDADGMASISGHEPIVDDILHWTMAVTLNVISGAAFSLQMAWPTNSVASKGHAAKIISITQPVAGSVFSKSHSMDFQTSLDLVMNHTPELILLPAWLLRKSPFKLLCDLQKAKDEFRQYMHEVISSATSTNSARGDLLSSMVKAGKQDKSSALSERETVGNIFVFVLAGHETTTTTLQTALIMLAANPQLQQEIQDEISGIWLTKKQGQDLANRDSPKMRVIMALMLETLRLFPPVVNTPKCAQTEQTISYRGHTVIIPPGSTVTP